MNNFPTMTEEQREAALTVAIRLADEKNIVSLNDAVYVRLLAEIALAALTSPPVLRVPDSWKLVPMVPTEAMIMAAEDSEDVLFDKDDDSLFIVDHKEIYLAMLENAPEASHEQ